MSVAEKPIVEKTPRSASAALAFNSLAGGAYILVAVWVVLAGLPVFWTDVLLVNQIVNEFMSGSLLLIVTAFAAVGLAYMGLQLEKKVQTRGLRSGAFIAALLLFGVVRVSLSIGWLLVNADLGAVGALLTAAVGVGLVYLLYLWFSMPGFGSWLGGVDESGWFSAHAYKGNQGVRIRRGTVVALLVLGFWGIITLVTHGFLGSERLGANDLAWLLPFSDEQLYLPLLFKVHLVVPILMGAVLVWFAWRVVNLPGFADFLIATEAEMNKVSWTTRKRLVQDTIVVLITLVFMTVFLFVVDILWIKILSWDVIYVLQVDTREARQKMEEKAQW